MALSRDELTQCLELVETEYELFNSSPPSTEDEINESEQLLDLKITLEREIDNAN